MQAITEKTGGGQTTGGPQTGFRRCLGVPITRSASCDSEHCEVNLLYGCWDDYDVQEVVGQGHYSIIYKARHLPTGATVAVKKVLNLSRPDRLDEEVLNLQMLFSARHTLRAVDVLPGDGETFVGAIVTPYVPTAFLGVRLSLREARWLTNQLTEAVADMHNLSIMHRDICPNNVLLLPPEPTLQPAPVGELVLADFGLAKLRTDPSEPYNPDVGTRFYRAPELVMGFPHYGPEVDVWGLGCWAASALLGRVPLFVDEPVATLGKRARCGSDEEMPLPRRRWPARERELRAIARIRGKASVLAVAGEVQEWAENTLRDEPFAGEGTLERLCHAARLPQDATRFLMACLTVDPAQRPTAAQLLTHPFLLDCGATCCCCSSTAATAATAATVHDRVAQRVLATRANPCLLTFVDLGMVGQPEPEAQLRPRTLSLHMDTEARPVDGSTVSSAGSLHEEVRCWRAADNLTTCGDDTDTCGDDMSCGDTCGDGDTCRNEDVEVDVDVDDVEAGGDFLDRLARKAGAAVVSNLFEKSADAAGNMTYLRGGTTL